MTGIVLVELPVLLLANQFAGTRLLMGIMSSLIGFIILYALHFAIGTLTVYLGNVLTLRDNVINFTTLLGGGLLPVAMLPGFVQKIAGCTPLPSIYYTSARIISDPSLSTSAVIDMTRAQLGWMVAFVALSLALWGISMRRYSPQGG
ncbi:MAG: ABC-2 family transporter protein [Bacillota bacterium]